MRHILFFGLISLTFFAGAQDYRVSLIPDSLKAEANAVKRFEELRVIIRSTEKAVIRHKYAITILNEKGDPYAYYENDYSNLMTLGDISGRLFDADGRQLRSVKKKDISDASASDDETLLTDTRIKRYAFYHKNYPYTVEFEDEQECNGLFFLPYWSPVENQKFSVVQSKLTVEVPEGYELRYRQFSIQKEPAVTKNKSVIYTWELQNFKAIDFEPLQPEIREILPRVYIAPSDFSIAGYHGNMRTWKDFGLFINELNKNRNALPENIKADVHRLTDKLASVKEKAKALYEFMQKNTRYISIQLGIGSWQPFDARSVSEKKYGDCKALSNYMVSLLREAGVKANYVLVTAGERRKGLTEDFPSPYFNHAICCVPDGKDTLWLECTNQTVAAGFMGTFTGDRKVLLIDEDGGHVVRTPVYKAEDNLQLRKIEAVVDIEGNLTADIHTRATGNQQELMHQLIYEATKEQREKYLNSVLSLPTYSVEKTNYTENKGEIPVIDEYIRIKASGYASVSGKRLFITPNLVNRSGTRFTNDSPRKYPVEFTYSFMDVDTIHIQVPGGYTTEALPKDQHLQTRFGNFDITYSINGNSIDVIRKQVRNRMTISVSEYPELVNYFETIYKTDRSRIVFVKKEGNP